MSSIASYTIAIIVYDTKNLTYQKQKKNMNLTNLVQSWKVKKQYGKYKNLAS